MNNELILMDMSYNYFISLIFLLLLRKGVSASVTIDVQPTIVYIPTIGSAEVAITCTANVTNVGSIHSLSLQRMLFRDSTVRNLVNMTDSTGPQMHSNAPNDLLDRNPTLEGTFDANDTSSYFTLSFNLTEPQCADAGSYICTMSYVDPHYGQSTAMHTMAVIHSPSNVSLALYQNGTEVEAVSDNIYKNLRVGDVLEFHLERYADDSSTYICRKTKANGHHNYLVKFTPNVTYSSVSPSGECNYLLTTVFLVEITEDDALRVNAYIIQCSVTSGTTVSSGGVYLEIEHDFCASSPCNNGTCNNTDAYPGYTCSCLIGYTGDNCDTLIGSCDSNPCQNGQCNTTVDGFTCICDTGYTGHTCDSEINYCSADPCVNGVCNSLSDGFVCTCDVGYTGLTCNTDVNECEAYVCTSNSTCINTEGGYICQCDNGFTGDGKYNCTEINYCSADPCVNGVCNSLSDGFVCTCDVGYTGLTCNADINECEKLVCSINSTCINTEGGYICQCDNGLTGDGKYNCTDINECETLVCTSNSTCINTEGGYMCKCDNGFTGDGKYNCTEIDNCSADPCVNGVCNSLSDGFVCTCVVGYIGLTCNTNINECETPFCTSNSTCINTEGGYICKCDSGFTGDGKYNCTGIDYCSADPCVNGVCNSLSDGFVCTCDVGYTGLTCNTDINECETLVCTSNATCINTEGGYICKCDNGFTGDGTYNCTDINECETNICTSNSTCINTEGGYICKCDTGLTGDGKYNCTEIDYCSNGPCVNGVCNSLSDGFVCTCDVGYTGLTCNTDINECETLVCASNSTCINTEGGNICKCDYGFTGDGKDNCTEIDFCSGDPCVNGLCNSLTDGFVCTCDVGYTGLTCNADINECETLVCASNSTCINTEGSYICKCDYGFTGDGKYNCTDINECETLVCTSNATCINTEGGYICKCDYGFTGDGKYNCTEIDYCSADPCVNGVCNSLFDGFVCTCHVGYTGLTCNTDINECETLDCANNATCINTEGGYICKCDYGFTGDGKYNCTEFDYCVTDPCQNGVCSNSSEGLKCTCHVGYTGLLCETDINECESTDTCDESAACVNVPGSYICTCAPGFVGDGYKCLDINECEALVCANNATCINTEGGYICQCDNGFTGDGKYNCTDINECGTNICASNSTCINTEGGYICKCDNGFTGDGKYNCTEIDYCSADPCVNGVCSSLSDGFVCTCDVGYTGLICNIDINECEILVCTSNATCINTEGGYMCKCDNGFTGDGTYNCADINECETNICASNSTCINTEGGYICKCDNGLTGDGKYNCTEIDYCSNGPCVNGVCSSLSDGFMCTCDVGYTGLTCNTDINECETLVCTSNSTCINTEGGYICKCDYDFTGDGKYNCTEIDYCSAGPCVNGVCNSLSDGFVCTCDVGYTGLTCNTDINECETLDCANNATCINTEGGYICKCDYGFTGDGKYNCTEIDYCSADPCVNGVCNSLSDGFVCTCEVGYTGLTCNTDINECDTLVCTSNSTCINTEGGYICKCDYGFTGDGKYNCTEFDYCVTDPCQNGVCSNSSEGLKCTCHVGYTGLLCDTDINECESTDTCDESAACVNVPGSYICTCAPGFVGDGYKCLDINECEALVCANNATCINTEGGYICQCDNGFTGDGKYNCTDINECETNICTSNSTCINTEGGYICKCDNGFTGDGKYNCTETDYCSADPCVNGVCSSLSDGFVCTCDVGYTGLICNIDINECETLVCTSNATCINTEGDYMCKCDNGFTGDGTYNCTEKKYCSADPCVNGVCNSLSDGFVCTCDFGYTGFTCNTDINECETNICASNSTCINTEGGYICKCDNGLTGDGKYNCTEIDYCSNGPCVNGVCSSLSDGFMCTCDVGYTGLTCNTDINECETLVCTSNSTCINTEGGYICKCDYDFTGDGKNNCTEIDYCSADPCVNGVCNSLSDDFVCTCDVGYTGLTCNTDINECETLDCANNATCINTEGGYICKCDYGFTGDGKYNCTEFDYCVTDPCQNGVCSNSSEGLKCTCHVGYTGLLCDTDINECESSDTCDKSANCVNVPGSYICTCAPGFVGDGYKCMDIDECLQSNPCATNGQCTNTPGSYICTCKPGFTGDASLSCTDINECEGIICLSNSTCINTEGDYICKCDNGFTGDGKYNCTDIDECLQSNPCATNGQCTNTPGSYICTCKPGFTGDGTLSCTDIDECVNTTCNNSGICQNTLGSFRCYCRKGWTGEYCDSDVDECLASPCATNAECNNNLGSFTCTCDTGYNGDGYTKCTQNVILDVTSQYMYSSDDGIYTFYLSGGIEYYGQRYYYAYVSMNGYIVLGKSYNSRYPWTNPSSWKALQYPIIAPLWTDIDTSGGSGDSGMYVSLVKSRSVLDKTIGPAFGDSNFRPTYCFVVTWKNAAPYPYITNHRFETADFQVLVATNNSYTYLMFNYDQEKFSWRPSGGRLVAVGYSKSTFEGNITFNSSTFQNVNKLTNVGINGRWRYNVSNPDVATDLPKALCRNWYYDSYVQSLLLTTRWISDPCPCTLSQIRRDRRYRNLGYRNGIHHYRQRWSQWPYRHRQRCHYKRYTTGWWWNKRNRGYLVHGYPGGGYMESHDTRLGISDAYDNCCVQDTGLCHLFYDRNPSRSCNGYRPPSWRPANGDPHITTFDKARYTFNGRGEFTLVEVKEENTTLTVQVRTELLNKDDPDATIFVGVAAKDSTTGDVVEVLLDRDTNSSDIYINGNHRGAFASSDPESVYIEAERLTFFNDSDKLVLAFESGISLQITTMGLLDIITSSPDDGVLAGTTRGLLGNNDGDINNDFMMKNGTILSINSTEEQLFDFGLSWRILKNESLFNYTLSGESFEFYNNLTIRPNIFIGDMLTNLSSYLNINCPGISIDASAIEEACGDNVACKVDAAATCDLSFGKASKATEEQVETDNEILENFPPNITGPGTLYIGFTKNNSLSLDMSSFVSDSNLDTINLDTSIPLQEFSFDNNVFQWNVSSTLQSENTSLYLRFIANDTMGASSEYWPNLYYCGCHGDTECDFSLVQEENDNEDHFYRARCNCSDDRDGIYCENIKDRCDPNPCYENVTCDSTKADNPCGECPAGLIGDGLRCDDTNECNVNPSPCNQTCDNIIGSYICSCNSGYILNEDQHNCDDINECTSSEMNMCEENQECINTIGSYTCQCAAGYAMVDDQCKNVTSSFIGSIVFVTTSDTTITDSIMEDFLLERISHEEPSVVSVEVINTREGIASLRTRDTGASNNYNTTFMVYSADDTLKTSEVVAAFNNYKQSYDNTDVIVTDESLIQITIRDGSKIYEDDEYGICNIVDKVICDLETTTCTNVNGVQACTCKDGFESWQEEQLSCQDVEECVADDSLCGEHGNCKNTIGDYQCECQPGYREDETRTCVDVCASNPCKNGGSCSHREGENSYSCQCQNGWTGFNCDQENNEDDHLRLIAIAAGSAVGLVIVVIIVVSVLLYRKYKVNSKDSRHGHYSLEHRDSTSRYEHLRTPRRLGKTKQDKQYASYQNPTYNTNKMERNDKDDVDDAKSSRSRSETHVNENYF